MISGEQYIFGGIDITGNQGIEYPLIRWDAWINQQGTDTSGGGVGDCDYVRFYAKGQEVFNIRDDTAPNSMNVTGNLHVSGDISLGSIAVVDKNGVTRNSVGAMYGTLKLATDAFDERIYTLENTTQYFDETGRKYVGTLQVDDIKTPNFDSIEYAVHWNNIRTNTLTHLMSGSTGLEYLTLNKSRVVMGSSVQ